MLAHIGKKCVNFMISNERPSPFARRPYGQSPYGQPKPPVQEDTLKVRKFKLSARRLSSRSKKIRAGGSYASLKTPADDAIPSSFLLRVWEISKGCWMKW